METFDLNRRDFHRLTMAAVGGILAGCTEDSPKPPTAPAAGGATLSGAADAAAAPASANFELAAVGVEKHVCRGLNACNNQGASGENACAGQGTCATVEHHACGGHNACKGQGGCGSTAVQNECAGKGGCHVPLMDDAWTQARRIFEAKLKQQGKPVGAAPASPKG